MNDQQQMTWKYQPMMIVVQGRLECKCGALAIYDVIDVISEERETYVHTFWCQLCWEKASMEDHIED